MSHRVGALLLPVPVPTDADESIGDPGLDILGDFFSAVLTTWLGAAWKRRAKGEPIVRKLYKHDPEELDFSEKDLPVLCIWRDGDTGPNRLADAYQETQTVLNILWIPPPTTQWKGSERFPFFKAFDSAMATIALLERHPSYVHAVDAARAGSDPLKQAAIAYGSDLFDLARIDWWRFQNCQRLTIDIPTGAQVFSYPAYVARFVVAESTDIDPTAFGTSPTVIQTKIQTIGPAPFELHPKILVPSDADPPP